MKILVVTDQFPPEFFGGMATHAYNIARYLGKKHEVLVVILHGQNSPEYEDEPFLVRPALTKRFPRLDHLILNHIARSFQPDAIHDRPKLPETGPELFFFYVHDRISH